MNEKNHNERSSPWLTILIGFGICAILAVLMLLPAYDGLKQKSDASLGRIHLKHISDRIQSYYSAGRSNTLPVLTRFEVDLTNDGGLAIDPSLLNFRSKYPTASYQYAWNPKLSGAPWTDWNQAQSPLIWDAAPHKLTKRHFVIFGDGHLADLTPEQLQELTR